MTDARLTTPRYVVPDGIPSPGGPYTPLTVVDGLIFVSGQLPRTEANDLVEDSIEAQARQVFHNMGMCLAAVGASLRDVIKVNVWLKDWDDFSGFNQVYEDVFRVPYPARTTIPAPFPVIRIEADCVARLPD
jgi:2-iminobutanoate/2-iminopropanoate deaminase